MTDKGPDKRYADLPLGREVAYPAGYDASVLCPVPRQYSRDALGIRAGALPFVGMDIWNAYELSWLDDRGKPVVARAAFKVPADTPAIIESKSFKLYLNSLNQARFADWEAVAKVLRRDLSATAGGKVEVELSEWSAEAGEALPGECLDHQVVDITDYALCPGQLRCGSEEVDERLYSHLLRSLCPVTGQPDWGSVAIHYRGPAIDREGLLRYIVGYRQHQEFHEQCVERIYMDIMARCQPRTLLVYARYLRRGGLDINPYRSSEPYPYDNLRLCRQ